MIPQQAVVPSARSPHVWEPPAESSVNVPPGGGDCP